ncbi:TetR/AcrR family transcriptional regulator [Ktedonospora formicarum]|uniref:Hypothetical regulatory protein, TetR family n=1 Tax=Ktedonospora formicarum TaxID=2778364 RepID=A0A8J3MT94_9CHLR|nr:TetR/AcrR family transcriptional regulator [Ktedonospora formicarum]GHO46915.1 hypothetical regulatory protein, TetR family [Ktedonospora formicarum]
MMNASDRSASTEARRKAILDAALALFLEKGFSETTMEDIRQHSGASTGSIYHHFKNKDMLARALYLEGRQDMNQAVIEALATEDPYKGLTGVIYAYLQWFEQNPELGQYVMQAADTEYLGAYIKVLRQKITTSISGESFPAQFLNWLLPFVEAGIIVRLPQQLYYPLAIGPSREFVRRWLRTRIATEMQEARAPLAEMAWATLSASHAQG